MTAPPALVAAFAATDPGVSHWLAYPAVDLPDGHDCDDVSERFVAFLTEHGIAAQVVELQTSEPVPFVGEHFVAVVGGTAYDWTARQWWSVPLDPADWLDPDTIPTPLVYPVAGAYPVLGLPMIPA